MVFHEITPEAIARAIASPRQVDDGLVDAYQARRVLDRLYGYEVSPVLWKKVMPKLSAGRVQSVATRLVVDRERDRIAFRPAAYSDLEAEFATKDHGKPASENGRSTDPTSFTANLVSVDGKRVAQGRDFTSVGELRSADVLHLDAAAAAALAERLEHAAFAVSSVERKPYRRSPYAPFRTTTLQQEASRKLGFSAKHTMSVAQRLYENGYITYMRTDSVTLSQTAISAARKQAAELYGASYVPDAPRSYAQGEERAGGARGHPAGRRQLPHPGPAGQRPAVLGRTPAVRADLAAHRRLADEGRHRRVGLGPGRGHLHREANGPSSAPLARSSASTGSSRPMSRAPTTKAADRDDQEHRLPPLAEADPLDVLRLAPAEHSTRPPARYTEASLVKELEDREIGRPSTYATILGTILDRGYVFKKGTALVPSFLAFAVITLLERHFGQLVDYEFTARMEDVLDEIARGEAERVPWLRRFYFGAEGDGAEDDPGLKSLVGDISDIDARDVSSFPLADSDIVVRVGRYGPYLERDGQRVNVPEDIAPDELTVEKAEELLSQPNDDVVLGTDPGTGLTVLAKAGRFGPYVTEQLPEDAPASAKPRTASLLKSMALDTVTLDDALRLLTLPRLLGELDGEPVTVQNGRYGPYAKKGTDSRSLESEEQLFTLTLAEAKELFAQPKARGRGARAATPPLRELGADPASGKPMVIKDGRFGPYVTDGETNASLRKGDEVASITDQRAAELLADRRIAPPATRRRTTTPRKKSCPEGGHPGPFGG